MTRNVLFKSLSDTNTLQLTEDNSSTITAVLAINNSFTLANNSNSKILPFLDHILSFLSKPDLTKTALVSKSWREKSTQRLWNSFIFVKEREFDRIFHILSKRQHRYGALIKSIELIHSDRDFAINANHIFLISYLCPNLENISITFHHTRAVAPPPTPHIHIHRQQSTTTNSTTITSSQKNLPLPMLQRQHLQQQQQHQPQQVQQLHPLPQQQQQQQQQQQSKGPHYTISLPLAHFSYNCPKLKSIKLDSYLPKTDDSVYEMAKFMTSGALESVTFANCMTLQSSTLCKLAITNPQLKRIELSGNTPVGDTSFATLMDRCGGNLEYLSISNAYTLTDKSMRYIASRCKKIKQICIFNNTERISEDTLTAIITHCPTLETISLSDSRCLGPQFFHSVVERVNIEIASIYQHQLTVSSGLQKLCLGGVKRDMIHSRYMKELIDKSASKNDDEVQEFVPESTIIRGNTVWWQRQRILISSTT